MRYLTVVLLSLMTFFSTAQKKFDHKMKLMGSSFTITVVAENQQEADKHIKVAVEEIKRIENLISSWKETSETSRINKNAGIKPIRVSKELFSLIERCQTISRITNGAFDISFASIDHIWNFDGSMKTMPDSSVVEQSVRNINYRNILLDKKKRTVFLKHEGMKIGFGAIGKGYAADKAKSRLQKTGSRAGIINASGDLTTWGRQPSGKKWTVGITNPLNKNRVFSWFPVDDRAVVTSGDYEQFVELNGTKYSHIIDPRTGYPAHGLASVTVFAPKAELADALATSIFVMGADAGINMVDQIKHVDCVIVDKNGNILKSKNIQLNTINNEEN
ncbi:MAG: FAD:protein FMN transferase [Bacteroidales bacterium]|nr:FAD:protein FMN transferase [Bacteroidales bacterium]MCF8328685.1 FAD:protein FMN transferase [Bacteroidales bacterium]